MTFVFILDFPFAPLIRLLRPRSQSIRSASNAQRQRAKNLAPPQEAVGRENSRRNRDKAMRVVVDRGRPA